MSLVEMQSALGRLYVDLAFLERFCADPPAVLRLYDLTSREARALTGIDRDALRTFAGSLRVKTTERFKHPYRLVFALGTPLIRKYIFRFYELRTMRPNESFYGPTLELGEFFERSFLDNPELPPYASDLARYERLFYLARFEPRQVRAVSTPRSSAPVSAESTLVPASGVRVGRFAYDMGSLEKSLDEATGAVEAAPEPAAVIFQSLPDVGLAKKFQVSAVTADLLELCDGTRRLSAIAAALDGDIASVAAAAQRLVALGLLEHLEAA